MTISKEIKFDCCHMLSNYDGKCANVHGHTYHGTVELTGSVGSDGMLMDYNTIKRIVDEYDHAIVFSSPAYRNEAEDELYTWAVKHKMRYVVSTFKSTAECIAQDIAEKLSSASSNIEGVTVKLSETDGSMAEAKI